LNMIQGSFRLESNLVVPRTYLKLLWMRRPLMCPLQCMLISCPKSRALRLFLCQ
jgi:hypothetical protein